jgi:hypothetical protein
LYVISEGLQTIAADKNCNCPFRLNGGKQPIWYKELLELDYAVNLRNDIGLTPDTSSAIYEYNTTIEEADICESEHFRIKEK